MSGLYDEKSAINLTEQVIFIMLHTDCPIKNVKIKMRERNKKELLIESQCFIGSQNFQAKWHTEGHLSNHFGLYYITILFKDSSGIIAIFRIQNTKPESVHFQGFISSVQAKLNLLEGS